MALVTRLKRFRQMAQRIKILRRQGVVLTIRDLEDFVTLIEIAQEAVIAEDDPEEVSDLARALAPFKESVETEYEDYGKAV